MGLEGCVSQRTVGWVEPILTGWAVGVHAEANLGPLVRIGPYYLHYDLPSNDRYIYFPDGPGAFSGGSLHALGARVLFVLPIAGDIKPYAFAGLGNTWLTYHLSPTHKTTGFFVEAPLGIGVTYDVVERFSISLDGAFRPAIFWGGEEFDGDGAKPFTGTSLLLGATLNL